MINYWKYLVLNIVINVITTYWKFFFVSVNIVINNMLDLKKNILIL